MRSTRQGARALAIATLIGTLLVSIAPVSSITAVEPTVTVDPAPTTDPAPAADPTPTVEPAPTVDPAPVVQSATAVPSKPKTTEAQQIIRVARRQLGDPWVHGARGPRAFDCSGLVIYAFKKAGDSRTIGRGHLASARALYHWFKKHHKASKHHPRVGDLVIWGGGTHVGIYIGHGKAISTLTTGVRVHRVHAVTARFTAYLHTGMWKKLAH